MRRMLAIAVPAMLLLGAPASAPAKGIVSAQVCGADGCQAIAKADERLLEGGPQAEPPAAREPFVRLNIRIGAPDHPEPVRLLFLPRSELLLGGDGTTWMVPMELSALRAIARRVKPFPASELPASAPAASTASAQRSGSAPLPPEIVQAPAPVASSSGFEAWWIAVPGAAIVVLGAGLALARRRNSGAGA